MRSMVHALSSCHWVHCRPSRMLLFMSQRLLYVFCVVSVVLQKLSPENENIEHLFSSPIKYKSSLCLRASGWTNSYAVYCTSLCLFVERTCCLRSQGRSCAGW